MLHRLPERKDPHAKTTATQIKSLNRSTHPHLVDTHQKWWQLGSIQVATGMSLPLVLLGAELSQIYGAASALLSIVIGNLILWAVGLIIVTMCDQHRKNTLENAADYFGKFGRIIVAFALLITLMGWFSVQLHSATSTMIKMLDLQPTNYQGVFIQIGVSLGIGGTLFSIFGIRGIKWISTITMPIFLFIIVCTLFTSGNKPAEPAQHTLTFAGIPLVVIFLLAGTVDFPTFFRHSHSRSDSIIAITCILLLFSFFEASGIYLGQSLLNAKLLFSGIGGALGSFAPQMLFAIFIILSCLTVNMGNVYAASIGWEALVPKLLGKKEYLIIGLVATALFSVLQIESYLKMIVSIGDIFIASMGVVLISGYLVRRITRRTPQMTDKTLYVSAWLIGVAGEILNRTHILFPKAQPLVVGTLLSLAVLGLALIIRELIWSIHHRR